MLAEFGGGYGGDMVGQMVGDSILRANWWTDYSMEKQGSKADAKYRSQIEQELLAAYGMDILLWQTNGLA